jgi:hypothetical protein
MILTHVLKQIIWNKQVKELWRGEKEEKKNQTKLKSGNREIM